jgi:Uma2 family endonuclease
MSPADPAVQMSYAEYALGEQSSPVRHEYLEGRVFAMAGSTPEHGALAAAIMGELRAALRGKPCRVYTSDLRVRVVETDMATYPDATVVCGKLETAPDDPDAVINPTLLVEVLSESTEAHDRGAKAAHYRRIASLKEYVLVAQDEKRIEVIRRNERGIWELHEARSGARVKLESLGVELEVDAVYYNPLPVE